MVGAAFAGLAIAAYLAAYQMRWIPSVWDPLFGSASTQKILDSSFSRVMPIPDAALGAIGYILDAVTGLVGGRDRWRSMPWIVLLFGFAVGPLGAISIFLVISQPIFFDAWCTLCLASAAISVALISPAADEVLASLQHLRRAQKAGGLLWKSFWGLASAPVATRAGGS
jgi:uncharacterized membrane protein